MGANTTFNLAIFGSAAVGGLFLVSFILWLQEKGMSLFEGASKFVRRPAFELIIVLYVVGGFVQYGATKGTNGNDRGWTVPPSRSAARVSPVAVDSAGFSVPTNFPSVTNLCFWGIDKGTNAVAFGIAWPDSLFLTNDTIDIFGHWILAGSNWSHLAEVDVSGAITNAVVELDFDEMPTNMSETAFFRMASQDDSDGDGLSDAIEEWVTGSNPAIGDSDGDGLGDGYEMSVGINPISADSDGDSLCDGEEIGWWEYGGTLPVFDVSGGEALLDPYDYYYGGSFIRRLPFNICCAGYVHNTVAIHFNGVVSLLNSRHSTSEIVSTWNQDYSTCLASHYNTVIAAYWDALAAIRNSGAQITFADVVHNSQRYAVIEYSNMRLASQSKDSSCVATFQVVIPQSEPNTVYVHYISVSGDFNGSSATVGAQLPERERVFPVAFNKAGSVYGGLVIAYHFGAGSNPLCNDSDADGLGDDVEAAVGSSSRYDDTDLDGMTDYWEYMHGLHPFSTEGDYGADGDPDGDRLVNIKESEYGADPQLPDTDNDGLTDGLETGYVFITDAIPWLTFDAYADVTTEVATNRFKRVEIAMPAPVLIQDNVVTNITMFRDGIFLMDKAGYSPAYGAPPVHGPSAVADRNALVIAPWHDSSVVFRDDIPGRHTAVRYGTATHNGEGYLLFEYLNVYADLYTSSTNAISYQLAIPTNKCDRAYSIYGNQTGQNTSGEGAYIGLQTFDALGMHTYCYHTAGKVWNGLCLEFRFGTNTDPVRADTDFDGLSDPTEILLGTNPRQPDTDGDGMNDGWEWLNHAAGFDPLVDNATDGNPDNDADADPDGDGLTNAEECEWGTDPSESDSDGDGVSDGAEIAWNSDPSDASDGGIAYSRVAVPFLLGDHSGSHSEKYRLDVSPVSGSGASPRTYSWVNEQYGQCETRTAMLKPGWRYEVRLRHASTNGHGAGYPDYDYKLECSAGNVLIDDPDGLFGICDDDEGFTTAEKVATITAYAVTNVTVCVPNDSSWPDLGADRVLLDDEELRIKIDIVPQIQSVSQCCQMFGGSLSIKTSGTCPVGANAPMPAGAAIVNSSGMSEVRIALSRQQLVSLGLMPQNDDDGVDEMAWLDMGSPDESQASNLTDSEAFAGLNYQFRGKATGDMTKTLESTPPNSIPSETFFKAAGAEVLSVEYGGVAAAKRQIMNQADYFYYSGHGNISTGRLQGGFGSDTADGRWAKDIDCVVFSGCSVLNIGDYRATSFTDFSTRMKYWFRKRKSNCEGSPGVLWENTGPKYLLGYCWTAPLDSQGANTIAATFVAGIQDGASPIVAWRDANNGPISRNACAIDCSATPHIFWYWDETSGTPVWTNIVKGAQSW